MSLYRILAVLSIIIREKTATPEATHGTSFFAFHIDNRLSGVLQ
jgi:hypothetical protein